MSRMQFVSMCRCKRQLLRFALILMCILLVNLKSVKGIRAKRSFPTEDDTSIRTELVDKSNHTILAMFNLTEDYLVKLLAERNANNKNSSVQTRDSQYFDNVKQYRLNDIKNRLQSAFQVNSSEESQDHPLHEMAAYPICNTDADQISWWQDNNITIKFSDSLFEPKKYNLNLDSAILRLYKVNPDNPESSDGASNANSDELDADTGNSGDKPKRCVEPKLDAQIRVTVSIVQQLRRNKRVVERKKRICNTLMMNFSKTGWVEIDIKRAIYIWENFERQQTQSQMHQTSLRIPMQVGWLMLEVHDEEERPLKPGQFFQPPKCDQADLAIPWNYYRPHKTLSPFAAHEVPRYPRLDVKLIGYASFAPKNFSKQTHQREYDSFRRQFGDLTKNSAEIDVNESTTTMTPTVDNFLESSASNEALLHNHHKRHLSHRHKRHHQHNHKQYDQQQHSHYANSREQHVTTQQYVSALPKLVMPTMENEIESTKSQVDHQNQHQQKGHAQRHRRHHNNNHHQHQLQKDQAY